MPDTDPQPTRKLDRRHWWWCPGCYDDTILVYEGDRWQCSRCRTPRS